MGAIACNTKFVCVSMLVLVLSLLCIGVQVWAL